MTEALDWLRAHLLDEAFATAFGALVGYLVGKLLIGWLRRRRYGGWTLTVLHPTKVEAGLTRRAIAPEQAEQVLNDPNRLAVFVKGVVSTYGWLNVDPVNPDVRHPVTGDPIYHETPRPGLLRETFRWTPAGGHAPHTLLDVDHQARRIVVDLDHNPPKRAETPRPAPPTRA